MQQAHSPEDQRTELPAFPVQSVTSIQYRNTSGTLTTWDSAQFEVVTDCDPVMIYPVPPYCWPATQAYRPDAVTITFVAGYELQTDDGYAAPDTLKLAVQSIVKEYWNRKHSQVDNQVFEEPVSVHVKNLLETYVRQVTAPASLPIRP